MNTEEKLYMNLVTGSVGTYDDWIYEDLETGTVRSAVDLGEVVPVIWDHLLGEWAKN